MTAARRQSSQPPVHRLTVPAGPVDGTGARGKMQGKIKGGGTRRPQTPVCTRARRGTRQVAARCCARAQARNSAGLATCQARRIAPWLDRGSA
jgi:hypothetical protein